MPNGSLRSARACAAAFRVPSPPPSTTRSTSEAARIRSAQSAFSGGSTVAMPPRPSASLMPARSSPPLRAFGLTRSRARRGAPEEAGVVEPVKAQGPPVRSCRVSTKAGKRSDITADASTARGARTRVVPEVGCPDAMARPAATLPGKARGHATWQGPRPRYLARPAATLPARPAATLRPPARSTAPGAPEPILKHVGRWNRRGGGERSMVQSRLLRCRHASPPPDRDARLPPRDDGAPARRRGGPGRQRLGRPPAGRRDRGASRGAQGGPGQGRSGQGRSDEAGRGDAPAGTGPGRGAEGRRHPGSREGDARPGGPQPAGGEGPSPGSPATGTANASPSNPSGARRGARSRPRVRRRFRSRCR